MTNQEIFERVGTSCILLSGILVSFSVHLSAQYYTFFGFLVGHIIWLTSGIVSKKKTLIEINAGFLLLDMWAISVRFMQ